MDKETAEWQENELLNYVRARREALDRLEERLDEAIQRIDEALERIAPVFEELAKSLEKPEGRKIHEDSSLDNSSV